MHQLNVWPEFGFRNGRGGAPGVPTTRPSFRITLCARALWANSNDISNGTYVHNFNIDPKTE
jgi:hypothetical protein